MSTLSDAIERYLKGRLSRTVEGVIEIRRSKVAEQFDCVPSQINYVLETRFTPQRGYYVESRRGGGGYIRILRAYIRSSPLSWESIRDEIGRRITSERADALIYGLHEIGLLTKARAALIRNALRDETKMVGPAYQEEWRAALLRTMLLMSWHDRISDEDR